jgi:hypothetical protein
LLWRNGGFDESGVKFHKVNFDLTTETRRHGEGDR